MIELGDLAFTAADFKFVDMCDSEASVSRYGPSQGQAERIAEEANRILAEKLSKAPLVYGIQDEKPVGWTMSQFRYDWCIRTSRLVCIAPISAEKKDE